MPDEFMAESDSTKWGRNQGISAVAENGKLNLYPFYVAVEAEMPGGLP